MQRQVKISIILVGLFILVLVMLGVYIGYNNWKIRIMQEPPKAPTNLVTKRVSATEISLTWQDNSNNELGFTVLRNGKKLHELPNDSEEYTDTRLRPATEYVYEITASNDAGESRSEPFAIKTKNPPIRVWIDKIGVADNGEDYLREVFDGSGEIFLGMVVSDGKITNQKRLPASDFYHLADNEVRDVGILAFSTDEVGDYLSINVIGFENDGGLGDELLSRALNMAFKASMGGLSSMILTAAGVDFTDTFKEIIGFEDDYLGEYQNEWTGITNWGVSKYSDIQHKNSDGNIGLRIWFRIECPVYDYSLEEASPQ